MSFDFRRVPSYRYYPLRPKDTWPSSLWRAIHPDWRHEQDRPHEDVEAAQILCVLLMISNLKGLQANILGKAELESLGVVVGQPLDVDETTWDLTVRAGQQYFQPWMLKDISEDYENPDLEQLIESWVWNNWRPEHPKIAWCTEYLYALADDLSPIPMGHRSS